VSEKGEFATGLYKGFEAILNLYELTTAGLSKKNRELLCRNRQLRDENERLRAELERREHDEEARIKILEGQRK
jgi:regulator of replication initiation timing